jgi:hypothetical protein
MVGCGKWGGDVYPGLGMVVQRASWGWANIDMVGQVGAPVYTHVCGVMIAFFSVF